jgi:hypothetical protein
LRWIVLALASVAAAGSVCAASYSRGHAVDDLDLPGSNSAAAGYAFDLNSDGSADNAFGSVLASIISGFDLDVAGATSSDTATGQIVHLVELRSSDAAFATDPAARATWFVGEATPAPPLFDGSDTFRYDANFVPGTFLAALSGSSFVSADPATTSAPVEITLRLRLAGYPIDLPLQGARLAFGVSVAGLVNGRVNGSIRKTDIDTIFVPALAEALNDAVQADPQSPSAMTLLGLFDDSPMDGEITSNEVANNPLMISLLSPDVDIRDAHGNYAPNPANTSKDALSFGFGFTATASQTLLPQIFIDGFEP